MVQWVGHRHSCRADINSRCEKYNSRHESFSHQILTVSFIIVISLATPTAGSIATARLRRSDLFPSLYCVLGLPTSFLPFGLPILSISILAQQVSLIRFLYITHRAATMPEVIRPIQQPEATLAQAEALAHAEALLAGVLAAAKAALPHQGLDLLVWGASRVGDQATLRHLLANGGGSSWTPSNDDARWGRDSCLRVASRFGHEGAVKELLESGVDVDEARADNEITPLYLASQEGHEGVTEQLLKAGADVDKAATAYGTTPLYIAAKNGHEGVVEQLLKAEADVDKAETALFGTTPLYIAAEMGHESVVEQLLKAGADVNKAEATFGANPLYIAARNGHESVVEQLLKAGADLNKAETAYYGTSPLYIAAQKGHEGVVEHLLKAGADPNTGPNPLIALSIASRRGHTTVCSLLLEAGANVNHVTGNEGTALKIAVARGHRDVALVLMEHGASSSEEALTPQMMRDLNKWTTEALQENKRAMAEKNKQMEEMVQGIPEWCALAASAVLADDEKHD